MIKEYVNSRQVMHFVDKATPDMSDIMRAEILGRVPKRLFDYRRQERMRRSTAEHILDAFDLGYLLYTGDIDTFEEGVKESSYQRIKTMEKNNRIYRSERDWWRNRAQELERKHGEPSLSPPKHESKDSVKALDVANVH